VTKMLQRWGKKSALDKHLHKLERERRNLDVDIRKLSRALRRPGGAEDWARSQNPELQETPDLSGGDATEGSVGSSVAARGTRSGTRKVIEDDGLLPTTKLMLRNERGSARKRW